MNGVIWFISGVWEAAFPFLLVAALVSAYVALMLAGRWFIQRGLRRRQERLWSTDPKTITDREVESLR